MFEIDENIKFEKGKPLKINNLFLTGNERTKSSVIEDELQHVYKAHEFQDVIERLHQANDRLNDMKIFENMSISLVPAKSGLKNETDLKIQVEEKKIFEVKVSTETTTDFEANRNGGKYVRIETQAKAKNPFGNAEIFTLSTGTSLSGSRDSSLKYSKPRIFGEEFSLLIEAKEEMNDRLLESSYSELLRGVSLTVNKHDNTHTISGELFLRDVIPRRHPTVPFACAASTSVIAESGPSFKASLRHIYTKDYRNSPSFPTRGSFFKLSNEVAGHPGQVSFVKSNMSFQKHYTLLDIRSIIPVDDPKTDFLVTLGLGTTFGATKSIGNDSGRPVRINDRFFMGGPLNLRGFSYSGIGPRSYITEGGGEEGDALGGEIQGSAVGILSFPFPHPLLARWGLKGMFFVNGGNLVNWDSKLSDFGKDAKMTTGFGIASTFFGTGRCEFTVSKVLKKSPNDCQRKFQLGFGMSFG